MKLIKVLRRLCMTGLFVIALYATFTSITNLSFADVHVFYTKDSADVKRSKLMTEQRVVQLKHKAIENIQLHEPSLESLENVMKEKQYPDQAVIATGYTAGVESTGKDESHPEYGITYSGVEVRRDTYSTIAADLSVFPLGTILYIPEYGYGVVADKGSAIKGNKIDLYYETVEDVYHEWGKKEVNVYIIEMGEGSLTNEQIVQLNDNDTIKAFQDE